MASNINYRFTNLPEDVDVLEIESHMDSVIEDIDRADNKYFKFDGDTANIVYNRYLAVEVVLKQVQEMGSYQLYKRIDKNLREMEFERCYIRAQFKLFEWRSNFFKKIYPNHKFDGRTAPRTFQVMLNFDVIAVLSASKFPKDKLQFHAFGPENENFANAMFDKDFLKGIRSLSSDMSYYYKDWHKDMLHIIYEVFKIDREPLKLSQYAKLQVIRCEAPIDDLPRELQLQVKDGGMFHCCADVQDLIRDGGKKFLGEIKEFCQNNRCCIAAYK